jgi:hypothetical protein
MKTQKSMDPASVQLAKKMLDSKKQSIKESQFAYKNNPAVKATIQKLKKQNAERGTPVVS